MKINITLPAFLLFAALPAAAVPVKASMNAWADFGSLNIKVIDTDPMDGIVPTLSFQSIRSKASGSTNPSGTVNWSDEAVSSDWSSLIGVSYASQHGSVVSGKFNGMAMAANTSVTANPVKPGSDNQFFTFANLVRNAELTLTGPGRLEITMDYRYQGFSEKQANGEFTKAAGFAELSLSSPTGMPGGYASRVDRASFSVTPDTSFSGGGRLYLAAQSFGNDPMTFMLRSSLGTEASLAVAAVPEPETYATMLAGGLVVGFAVRRSRRAKAKQSA
ncbi:PEP-CTERM sorting domain-containing protein [Chitinivorax sp. B]|uniref:PEP-CTERM sorting domain-containing protein n=1 Tax=Chitinivorax sp. B TaxID=2502235 RepID=UPI002017CCBE|nr:PEP-CTERM sorting domain-containing protein [Chitinivorax sp. B]